MTAFNVAQTGSFSGLQTVTFTAPVAGGYWLDAKLSLPQLSTGASANSAVVATVSQNSTPVLTSIAGAEGFRAILTCAVGDTISVTLSSAAAVDNVINAVKGVVVFTNSDAGTAALSGYAH
jgi:hypothetical protein